MTLTPIHLAITNGRAEGLARTFSWVLVWYCVGHVSCPFISRAAPWNGVLGNNVARSLAHALHPSTMIAEYNIAVKRKGEWQADSGVTCVCFHSCPVGL